MNSPEVNVGNKEIPWTGLLMVLVRVQMCLLLKWSQWNITNSKCKGSMRLREHCHKLNVMSVTISINKCWNQKFQHKQGDLFTYFNSVLSALLPPVSSNWNYIIINPRPTNIRYTYLSHGVTLKMCNIGLISQHLMAFLMHISLKFWSSAAATNHLILAHKG